MPTPRKTQRARTARRTMRVAAMRGAEPGRMPDEPRRPPTLARESIEDPLEDWPDDGDRWLLERNGEDIERETR